MTPDQIKDEELSGTTSDCCNATVVKTFNRARPGDEEEFWCKVCDKECELRL